MIDELQPRGEVRFSTRAFLGGLGVGVVLTVLTALAVFV